MPQPSQHPNSSTSPVHSLSVPPPAAAPATAPPAPASSTTPNPAPALAPESIFGWPAFLTALQSFLTSFSLFKLLADSTLLSRSRPPLLPHHSNPASMSLPHFPSSEIPTSAQSHLNRSASTNYPMLPVAQLTPPAHAAAAAMNLVAPDTDATMSTTSPTTTTPAPTDSPSSSSPSALAAAAAAIDRNLSPHSLRLTSLPDELIAMCYAELPAPDLVSLEHVSMRLRTLIADDALCWRRCVLARWAHLTSNKALFSGAARHAGSWKTLYSEKAQCDAAHNPWLVLCRSEILAVLDVVKGDAQGLTPTPWGDSAGRYAGGGASSDDSVVEDVDDDDDDAVIVQDVDEEEEDDDDDDDDDIRDHGITPVIAAPSSSASSAAALPASPPSNQTMLAGAAAANSASPVSVVATAGGAVAQGPVLSIVLLFDASSSVTDEDFNCMKRFALTLVENLRVSLIASRRAAARAKGGSGAGTTTTGGGGGAAAAAAAATTGSGGEECDAAVAVVQFNQHPRVEVPLTKVNKSKLSTSIENMDQLMGSTDIAAPIRRARQILAEEAAPGDRVIVLLTDGQTHADELCESEKEARKAYEEVGARLYTLGVGRDIDEGGLGRVAGGSDGGQHFTLRRLLSSK